MTDNNPPAASSGGRTESAGRHAAPEDHTAWPAPMTTVATPAERWDQSNPSNRRVAGMGRHRALPMPPSSETYRLAGPATTPIARPIAQQRKIFRRWPLVGGVAAAVLAIGLGVAVIAAVAADEPRALPPPPNNPGVAGYSPANVERPVEDTLPVGPAVVATSSSRPSPAATTVSVTPAQPSRSTAATTFGDPAGAPASVTALGSGDPWPSSAFGSDPPVGADVFARQPRRRHHRVSTQWPAVPRPTTRARKCTRSRTL
jgi:hypothetical protein